MMCWFLNIPSFSNTPEKVEKHKVHVYAINSIEQKAKHNYNQRSARKTTCFDFTADSLAHVDQDATDLLQMSKLGLFQNHSKIVCLVAIIIND